MSAVKSSRGWATASRLGRKLAFFSKQELDGVVDVGVRMHERVLDLELGELEPQHVDHFLDLGVH